MPGIEHGDPGTRKSARDGGQAIHDPWPADDEAMVAGLAGMWRTARSVLAQGTQGTTRAAEASPAAWPDAGLAGPAMQNAFAAQVAADLRQMIAAVPRNERVLISIQEVSGAL